MPPVLEQSAANSVAKYQSRTCTATFSRPTTPGSLLVAVCVAAGTLPSGLTTPAGFTHLASRGLRDMQMSVWYRQAAPATNSVSVTTLDAEKSLQVRVLEYSGMAQANVVDKLSVQAGESDDPFAGPTGTTAQADELALAFIGNQYASAVQAGFSGGLVRLFEGVSPQSWSRGTNQDWERARYTVHQAATTAPSNFTIRGFLSSERRWMAVLVTFRGASTGPARFTSTTAPAALTAAGTGALTVFGPLRSTATSNRAIVTSGRASVLPFNYQFLLPNGLMIGQDTVYRVVSHDGLYGHDVRSSDEDQPRGDGSLRGVDLQSARQVLFKIQTTGTREEIELRLDLLYRALVPQRDTDWDLVWRHPATAARLIRVRPIQLPREIDQRQIIAADQSIALRAADPRHYSAVPQRVVVPVTPAGAAEPLTVNVFNDGNIPAYPVITISGPTSGPAVSRIELVNATTLISFEARLVLAKGSTLVGDMQARITGAPRSVVTLDGQSKYGSWQLPRSPFRLDPDATGRGGFNTVYLRTEPAGAPVTCTLDFRSSWSG